MKHEAVKHYINLSIVLIASSFMFIILNIVLCYISDSHNIKSLLFISSIFFISSILCGGKAINNLTTNGYGGEWKLSNDNGYLNIQSCLGLGGIVITLLVCL